LQHDREEYLQLQATLPSVERDTRDLWHDESGIPGKFYAARFDTFDSTLQPKAFSAVKQFDPVSHFDDKTDLWSPVQSIVLSSPGVYGVGKTHLAAALANHLIDTVDAAFISRGQIMRHHCPVFFVTETRLLGRIRATYNDGAPETESAVFEALAKPDLLIIDDVGKVKPRDYSFLQRVYFEIIDGRYTSEMPIMMTSNLSWAELETHIGGASADRLREMCGPNLIKMTGKSYRTKGGTTPTKGGS
jgi:DNA replication protein DnaC